MLQNAMQNTPMIGNISGNQCIQYRTGILYNGTGPPKTLSLDIRFTPPGIFLSKYWDCTTQPVTLKTVHIEPGWGNRNVTREK